MGYIVGVVGVNDIDGKDNDGEQLFVCLCVMGVDG